MGYTVKEIFATLQGEGRWTGRRAVFMRFAGCNIWSGLPEHRERGKAACSKWCDTDFNGGRRFAYAGALAEEVLAIWAQASPMGNDGLKAQDGMVVITGGEPGLQLDIDLVDALHVRGFFIAVETNGSIACPAFNHVDHLCVSPKLGAPLLLSRAHEIKVVLPGAIPFEEGWTDADLELLDARGSWGEHFVQPMDSIDPAFISVSYLHAGGRERDPAFVNRHERDYQRNLGRCLDFIATHPRWRLSAQTHKYIGAR